ncbi:uncharacterized protein LOC139915632 [Centroberyx gerrardi]|uniref:uncharacterized protein n=1 Tax=Centroberyx gerrardi TaxID=166262 RepID=UPI003AB0605F
MIVAIILSCLAITASAIPVNPNIVPPLPAQGGALPPQRLPSLETINQKPEAQALAPIQPSVQQPQPGLPQQQQPGPQGGPQFLPPLQHHPWSPQGGSPMIFPLQPNIHGHQLTHQPPQHQQPMVFPSYGYYPVFPPMQRNHPFSPYGYPMIFQAPLPQIPANQPPTGPVAPVETPSGPVAAGNAPPPTQQQQNPQIVYMFQPPMNSPLGGLSSEELEMAARMGRVGVYMPTIHTNMPAEAPKLVLPPAGPVPVNPGLPTFNLPSPGVPPTTGISSGGVPPTQGVHPGLMPVPGTLPEANNVPAGLGRPAQDTATAQAPVQPNHQPYNPLFLATPPPLFKQRESFPAEAAATNSVANGGMNSVIHP